MDVENGMIIDELWQDRKNMSDEEYDEWIDHMDTLREEREGY